MANVTYMAPYRAYQTTTTTGTGTLTLIAAPSNQRSFQAVYGASSIVVPYVISNASAFEIGAGTFDGSSPGTLTRSKIFASSNAGNAVSLAAGTHDVYIPHVPGQWGAEIEATDGETWGPEDLVGAEYIWLGSISQTLTIGASTNVPHGLGFRVRNRGTAQLTIDPSGSETINGLLQLALSPGDWVELKRRHGSGNWDVLGNCVRRTTFTASGTFLRNPTSRVVEVEVYGAGGGGGAGVVVAAATACSGGGGGGGGGAARVIFRASELLASETVTIGAGGTGGTTTGQHGTAGGASQFGSFVHAKAWGGGGGSGGASGANSGGGGGGGTAGVGGSATSGTGGSAAVTAGSAGGSGGSGSSTLGVGSGSGGAGTTSGSSGNSGGFTSDAGQGGSSGGGINGANTPNNGGLSGWGGTTNSTAGVAPGGAAGALATRADSQRVAYGGGGGGAAVSVAGGAGVAGQGGGGGGGGGGSTQTGYAPGAGGNGGAGMVIITEW